MNLLKPYKDGPPTDPIIEEPLEFQGQEEILQPRSILKHEEKLPSYGKTIFWYLIKFRNYPFEDAQRWVQGI